MSKIQILPDQVANQIAAGEVVERPVSVIKELVENSIDAGAKRIEVEFRNGGKNYMRVEDDGCGMGQEDARLSLQRHATSKITAAKDLNTIGTFGFRGEALPSIASVSRFTLKTKEEGSSSGWEIAINGGKVVHERECGMGRGTMIEVVNLFNTVPARRKFLKTENTEAAHITNLVRLYAIANPEVGFVLKESGRVIFQSPPVKTLKDRIGRLWNKKLADELVEIEGADRDMRLRGLISKPGVGRSTRQEMITFVNGRPVDSKTLNYAVIEGYHTYIPKGRYPVVFLFLEIDSGLVDVNVHPAKKEVRFRQEGILRQFVIEAVMAALKAQGGEDVRDFYGREEVEEFVWPEVHDKSEERERVEFRKPSKQSEVLVCDSVRQVAAVREVPRVEVNVVPVVKEEPREEKQEVKTQWRFLGHIKEGYALFETAKGVVVLNCRGARQRIRYETIKRELERQGSVSQDLLLPVSVELEALMSSVLEDNLKIFEGVGFGIERFGRGFYRIYSIPGWLKVEEVEGFVTDILEVFKEQGGRMKDMDLLHERIAQLVVNETSGMGKGLMGEQAEQFVEELMRCEQPQTCPRGYPTFFEMSSGELDRRFGR